MLSSLYSIPLSVSFQPTLIGANIHDIHMQNRMDLLIKMLYRFCDFYFVPFLLIFYVTGYIKSRIPEKFSLDLKNFVNFNRKMRILLFLLGLSSLGQGQDTIDRDKRINCFPDPFSGQAGDCTKRGCIFDSFWVRVSYERVSKNANNRQMYMNVLMGV